MGEYIRRLYCAILTAAGFFAYGVPAVAAYPYFYLTGFKENEVRSFIYYISRFCMGCVKRTTKSFCVEGALPTDAAIIVANHGSILDILCFCCFGSKDYVFVTKGWASAVPIMRRYIRTAGYICSDENGSFEDMVSAAKTIFAKGLKLVIFPEGTRSADGTVGRFHSGAFLLAARCNVPIIPVALKGLDRVIAKRQIMAKGGSVVRLSMLLPCKADNDHLRMARAVKEQIVKKLSEV
ncbi:hypothetical protein FACS189487_03670 [Campylobacterota bacterium]|nr:hypothetical protein FACS189487_03670 [Campylobacterota bacterium]